MTSVTTTVPSKITRTSSGISARRKNLSTNEMFKQPNAVAKHTKHMRYTLVDEAHSYETSRKQSEILPL